MPYWGPQVQPTDAQSMAQTGAIVSANISEILRKRDEEKKQEKISDELMKSSDLRDVVPASALERYNTTRDREEKHAIVTSALQNYHMRQESQQQQMAQTRLGYEGQRVGMEGQRLGMEQQNIGRQNQLADANIGLIKARTQSELASGGADGATQIDPYVDPVSKQPVAGMGIVRKTGRVVTTGGGEVSDPDQYGRYWNGKQWVQLRKDKVDPVTAMQTADRSNQVTTLTQQIAEHQTALDKGDTHVGGLFGIGATDRAQVLAGLKAKRDSLLTEGVGQSPSAAGAPKVGEVRRGYRFKGGDPADRNNWEQAQ